MTATRRQWIVLLGALLVWVALAVWLWPAMGSDAWKYDEGLNVAKARLLRDGYRLYRDVWSDQPPLFTWLLRAVFVISERVLAGRLLVCLLSCAALVGVAGLALEWGETALGALVGVVLLGLHPHFQELSRLIMIGLPAISLGVLSLWLGARALGSDQLWPWVTAGAVFALGLAIKPIIAPYGLALCAIAWSAGEERARGIELRRLRLGWLLLGMAAVGVLVVLLSDSAGLVRQVVGTLFGARGSHPLSVIENARAVGEYLGNDKWGVSYLGYLVLALVGLGCLWREKRGTAVVLLVWFGASALSLLLQTPLRRHHLALILPPLTVTAGLGISGAWGVMRARKQGRERLAVTFAALGVALLISALPQQLRTDGWVRSEILQQTQENADRRAAIEFLQSETPADALVFTDDPMLVFVSGRRIPPELAVPSARRVEAGEIQSDGLIALTESLQPEAILFWEERLTRLDAFDAYVRTHYVARRAFKDGRWIYGRVDQISAVLAQVAVATDGGLSIQGSAIERLAVEPGGVLSVDVLVRREGAVEGEHTLFAHLVDGEGVAWGQQDTPPLDGIYLCDDWPIGETVAQKLDIIVAEDAPPGEMMLAVGLYDGDGHRFDLVDEQGEALGSGQIVLASRPVVHWTPIYDVPHMDHVIGQSLGGVVELLGCDVPTSLQVGSESTITLYWRCLAEMNTSYTVFCHVVGPDGELLTQADGRPALGQFPTTGWGVGEVIADGRLVSVPSDSAVGSYSVMVGMYDLTDGTRLPVDGDVGAGGAVSLPVQLQIVEAQ